MTTVKQPKNWTPDPANESVLPIRSDEIEAFETEVENFRAGKWDENAFMAFRLKQGVYGQRQPDAQMVRIKLPFGGINAKQLNALGRIAAEFAPLKKGHLTTRENMQFHHIQLQH